MTVIVGLEANGKVIMGGDSAGVAHYDLSVRQDTKVFIRGPFVMGFTTSFRMGQILRWQLKTPDHPDSMCCEEYMMTRFIDAVRECLKDGGFARKKEEAEEGGTFLVGYRGKLFVVEGDYQVGMQYCGYHAVGCGYAYALGSLYQTNPAIYDCKQDPINRVLDALMAADAFSAGVSRPFVVKEL